ncbi:hypothetical protein AN958_04816, partial [Leucoagaricus sp. SymC.cos]
SYNTYMSFLLNGNPVGEFQLPSSGAESLVYDQLVYQQSGLPLGRHNITIVNGKNDGQVYVMTLDYLEYTTDISDPSPATSSASMTHPSKSKVLTGVLVAICILFAIVLAYLLYRLYHTRVQRPKTLTKADIETIPASQKQITRPSVWGWVTRLINVNASKRSIAFNPSLFVAGRPRLRSESSKDLPGQHHSQAILLHDELDTDFKKSVSGSRWAFITSWRDRAVMEAEIPSLPPTSHAPTTVLSGPTLARPSTRQILQQQQQQQDASGTQRPARRTFTIMNT